MPKPASRSPARRVVPEILDFDVADFLDSPDDMASYLDAWLQEHPDDAAGIARAIGNVARASGMTDIARETGLSRESLYRALGGEGNPTLATVVKVLGALGLRLQVTVSEPSRAR